MGKTTIEWTSRMRPDGTYTPGFTYNPWWGCVRVSAGCQLCYAETSSKRWGHDIWGVDKPRRFFGDKHWMEPVKWNKEAERAGESRFVFCASMADWLEDREDLKEPRERLMDLIEETPYLIWLLLTKRIENAIFLADRWLDGAPGNVWFGVTTEDQESYDKRIEYLTDLRTHFDAAKVWLSIEPQLGPIKMRADHRVDWAIVGGESGAGCRPFNLEWARDLKRQCEEVGTSFFLKQLGGHPDKKHDILQFPEDLRVREFPNL